MRAAVAPIALFALMAQAPAPTLDEVLDRMNRYLLAYESQLSAVIGEERYEQRVPLEMRETFPTAASRGDGRATYRNFRRFQTSARIVPQQLGACPSNMNTLLVGRLRRRKP